MKWLIKNGNIKNLLIYVAYFWLCQFILMSYFEVTTKQLIMIFILLMISHSAGFVEGCFRGKKIMEEIRNESFDR